MNEFLSQEWTIGPRYLKLWSLTSEFSSAFSPVEYLCLAWGISVMVVVRYCVHKNGTGGWRNRRITKKHIPTGRYRDKQALIMRGTCRGGKTEQSICYLFKRCWARGLSFLLNKGGDGQKVQEKQAITHQRCTKVAAGRVGKSEASWNEDAGG